MQGWAPQAPLPEQVADYDWVKVEPAPDGPDVP